MKIRPRAIPPGWYPETGAEIRRTIARYLESIPEAKPTALSVVAPHAGWEFSGRIALEVILSLKKAQTIVVVGGHLWATDEIVAAFEDGYYTPLGAISADLELLEGIRSEIEIVEDRQADNTVEIQLPFIRYGFPDSRVLSFRAPPSGEAVELGRAIKKAAQALHREVAVVGSTDLTHYGSNYGFSPQGRGEKALHWAKEVNDKEFIERLVNLDVEGALRHAQENQSACSAGGAAAAVSFARESGIKKGDLVRYLSSYDLYPSESFVGYAGIVYRPAE